MAACLDLPFSKEFRQFSVTSLFGVFLFFRAALSLRAIFEENSLSVLSETFVMLVMAVAGKLFLSSASNSSTSHQNSASGHPIPRIDP